MEIAVAGASRIPRGADRRSVQRGPSDLDEPLVRGHEYECALFGAQKVADALGVGLNDGADLTSASVVDDRDDVIAPTFVPDRVALLERALGVAKLPGSVREADDQRRHREASYRQASSRHGAFGKLACDEHSAESVRADLGDEPEIPPVSHVIADLGNACQVADFSLTTELEAHALMCLKGHRGTSFFAPAGAMAWAVERQSGRGAVVVLAVFPSAKRLNEPVVPTPLVFGEQHASKLCEGVCPDVVECPEDAFAIFDRERDYLGLECERLLEKGACWLVHERDELAHVLVGDPQAGEVHGGEGTPWVCMS